MTVREVGTDEGYRLIEPLVGRHYNEIAKFRDLWSINPDFDKYRAMEANGRLLALVAERHDLGVVGYSVNFLTNNLHYAGTMVCQNDLLYVIPELRNSRAGLALMHETIFQAKQRGAKIMMWHAKPDTALNAMLPKQGYEVLDVIWAKAI